MVVELLMGLLISVCVRVGIGGLWVSAGMLGGRARLWMLGMLGGLMGMPVVGGLLLVLGFLMGKMLICMILLIYVIISMGYTHQ